jgi:hypothetical protein
MPDRIPNIVAHMVAKAATLRHDAAAAKDPEIGEILSELAGEFESMARELLDGAASPPLGPWRQ